MDTNKDRWPEYQPQIIEPKWQNFWQSSGLYLTDQGLERPKFYCLEYFPYPSGEGLHVGHCKNYIPTDVLSRYKRMIGFNVLHPMGWDSFGEPTEHFAITHGIHPRITTDRNTSNFKRQLQLIGTSYDWQREIDSSRPEYYRWTQWFFRLLYLHNLAYRDTHYQWWCPVCQTTLSSHEIQGSTCWRGHSGVYRKKIPAWYFRITAYAEELLSGLDEIDWPEPIKSSQRNWIGKSEGTEITFTTDDGIPISVFTTRPDTIFGVTFFGISPEHDRLKDLTTPDYTDCVNSFVNQALQKSEIERMSNESDLEGVFTGSYVKNPLTGDRVPVWVADYILPGYGTGAIMGVPAHDARDWNFAKVYDLPVKRVVINQEIGETEDNPGAFTGNGVMVNAGDYDGLSNTVTGNAVTDWLIRNNSGKRSINYKMRDWLISRQRYWGTPIPVIHCHECGIVLVPEDQLPVLLPETDDFEPDGSGRSPLAKLQDFVNIECPTCGGPAKRETDTLGGFACSSWYFLRFTSPDCHHGPFQKDAANYWMPVDLYVGGAEHAVLHLLYARFWTKFLADCGLVSFREPFQRLLNQGQLMGPDGFRMSKSRGNVVTPDHIVERYGADALRVYELFMAPFNQDTNWSESGIIGAWRFVNKIWLLYKEAYFLYSGNKLVDERLLRNTHRLIQRVTQKIEAFRFNTLISDLMEFVNDLVEVYRQGDARTGTFRFSLDTLMVLIAPVVPHMAEELWSLTGHKESVHKQPWPKWDREILAEEMISIPVQINGRLKAVIDIQKDADQEDVRDRVLSDEKLNDLFQNRSIHFIHYVPNKIINFVVVDKENE